MDLPIRLLTWRTFRGLTLQEVSDRCEVSVFMLCRAETGRHDLSTRRLQRVVRRGLRTTMVEFWGELPKVRLPKVRTGRPRSAATQQLTRARAA
jgi:transcriptional regulator with XRE-family HTH domain